MVKEIQRHIETIEKIHRFWGIENKNTEDKDDDEENQINLE